MKKLMMFLVASIIAISSCSATNINISESEIKFSINKELVEKGVLKIILPSERPTSLAIQTPKGEWFILQDSSESIQVMSQSQFNSIEVMRFELNNLMGIVWRDGVSSKEIIFENDGTYLVYFANNLETETENTFSFRESVIYSKSITKRSKTTPKSGAL